MGFEENRGQAAHDVKFVSHGSGYAFSLAPQEIDIAILRRRAITASPLHRAAALRALREARKAMKTTVIRMQLQGANPAPRSPRMSLCLGSPTISSATIATNGSPTCRRMGA